MKNPNIHILIVVIYFLIAGFVGLFFLFFNADSAVTILSFVACFLFLIGFHILFVMRSTLKKVEDILSCLKDKQVRKLQEDVKRNDGDITDVRYAMQQVTEILEDFMQKVDQTIEQKVDRVLGERNHTVSDQEIIQKIERIIEENPGMFMPSIQPQLTPEPVVDIALESETVPQKIQELEPIQISDDIASPVVEASKKEGASKVIIPQKRRQEDIPLFHEFIDKLQPVKGEDNRSIDDDEFFEDITELLQKKNQSSDSSLTSHEQDQVEQQLPMQTESVSSSLEENNQQQSLTDFLQQADNVIEEPLPLSTDTSMDSRLLKAIREGIENDHIDLFLQRITSLEKEEILALEASSYIYQPKQDTYMEPDFYRSSAVQSGLISAIDILSFVRCMQIARRLYQGQKKLEILCNVSLRSLSQGQFYEEALDVIKENQLSSTSLYLHMMLDDVMSASDDEIVKITTLLRQGVGLSVEVVAETGNLSRSMNRLLELGCRYVKMPLAIAQRLESTLKQHDSTARLIEVFQKWNVTLIVSDINSQQDYKTLLRSQLALLGQGNYLGPCEKIDRSRIQIQ